MAIAVKVDLIEPGVSEVRVLDETFVKDEVSIGRTAGNDIVLAAPEVSGKHAKLFTRISERSGERVLCVMDLRSSNGTFLEDLKLPSGEIVEMKSNERLVIGSYLLTPALTIVSDITAAHDLRELRGVAPAKEGTENLSASSAAAEEEKPAVEVKRPASEQLRKETDVYEEEFKIRRTIHDKLIDRLDLRRKDIVQLSDEDLRKRARAVIEQILVDLRWEIPEGLERETLISHVLDEALGLGPLEELLADDSCSEIMINSYKEIYAERRGKLELTNLRYSSEQAVLAAIERILAPIGRRVDESSPMVDARLKDGSRVNAVIRPLALKGPCITIRKFSKTPLTIDDLVRYRSLSSGMAEFLRLAVSNRLNVVISGGTGSGKTTLLNIISSFVPEGERVITVEDAAELRLPREHLISFETRPPNLEGKGAITVRDLVRNALRMRPDRIIVGECRGAEAIDMLQAMNTGHDGSMTTGHANSEADMVRRLETMVLTAGLDLPVRAVREQIASAVDVIVQQTRFACGTRIITGISEVVGMDYDEGTVTLEDVFVFHQEGYGADGRVQGYHQATGYVPKFFKTLQQRGVAVNADVFSPGRH
jgi:pilus assembly protein CpaF